MSAPSSRERVLRIALRVYPPSFRARFEDELLQVCLEDLRAAGSAGSGRSPARTLLATLVDLARSGIGERIVGSGSVAPGPLARTLGLIGLVGGLLLVSAFVSFIPGAFNTTRLILFEFFVRFVRGEGRPFRALVPPSAT